MQTYDHVIHFNTQINRIYYINTFPNIDLILYFCYKNTIGYDVLGFFFLFLGGLLNSIW